jgi:hypothetical protein
MALIGISLSMCGPASSRRPYELKKPTSLDKDLVPWKIKFSTIETDSMERLFGNVRMNLTGGHGNADQVFSALSSASMGSLNILNSEVYKTNCTPSEDNTLSFMLSAKFDSARPRPLG